MTCTFIYFTSYFDQMTLDLYQDGPSSHNQASGDLFGLVQRYGKKMAGRQTLIMHDSISLLLGTLICVEDIQGDITPHPRDMDFTIPVYFCA